MSPVHVRAEPGDFAESVLLPDDPRRANYIAENFFDDAKLVTDERRMLGYTGSYKGKPVSVQATDMGCPSAALNMCSCHWAHSSNAASFDADDQLGRYALR